MTGRREYLNDLKARRGELYELISVFESKQNNAAFIETLRGRITAVEKLIADLMRGA